MQELPLTATKMEYEKFEPLFGDWALKFRPFIEGEDFFNIYQKLKADSMKEKIYPKSQNVFRSFQKTSTKNLKAIFFLMDPYPRAYKDGTPQATGIPMDCSNSPDGKLQPSLTKFYDAMSKTIGQRVEYSPNLEYLLDQGVMLLNTDLTVKAGKTGSHSGLWLPFMKYFLEEVLASYPGIYYVLCGKDSEVMKKFINPFAKVTILTHPSFANRAGTDWDDKGIFNTINKHVVEQLGEIYKIHWDKRDYDEHKAPF